MTSTTQPITPLRQRMIDDMRMRKLSPYIRVVKRFAKFLGRSRDTANAEDLRNYQLYLVDHGISSISLNATILDLESSLDSVCFIKHLPEKKRIPTDQPQPQEYRHRKQTPPNPGF